MSGSESYENPLIPNGRLRQILLAMARARAFERALPPAQRVRATGLEACLVAPAIDLNCADLISDALNGATLRFLRGASVHDSLETGKKSRARGAFADAGPAAALPFHSNPAERLWAAAGAAAALAALPCPADTTASSLIRNVLIAYLSAGQVAPAQLRTLFAFVAAHQLRIVFVAIPGFGLDRGASSRAAPPLAPMAQRSGIPGIAVDCHDAVAIYRVAQESIGRARAGGGPALIDCVPYPLPRGTSRARQTADPVAAIEWYILERAIATPAWIARETRAFLRHLPHPVH